jgi:hypothetical protein
MEIFQKKRFMLYAAGVLSQLCSRNEMIYPVSAKDNSTVKIITRRNARVK